MNSGRRDGGLPKIVSSSPETSTSSPGVEGSHRDDIMGARAGELVALLPPGLADSSSHEKGEDCRTVPGCLGIFPTKLQLRHYIAGQRRKQRCAAPPAALHSPRDHLAILLAGGRHRRCHRRSTWRTRTDGRKRKEKKKSNTKRATRRILWQRRDCLLSPLSLAVLAGPTACDRSS